MGGDCGKPKGLGWLGYSVLAGTALGGFVRGAAAQEFTKADSGWVPLFNGRDYDGLYSRLYNQPVTATVDPAFRIAYPGTDSAEINIKPIGGEIGTNRIDYAHYRMRVQYRFEAAGSLNAGFLYAVDETYPRMGGDGTVAKAIGRAASNARCSRGTAGTRSPSSR